jgi:hypothetical protein
MAGLCRLSLLHLLRILLLQLLPVMQAQGPATNCTPEAFGGKADGSDATAALQTAIDSCSTVHVGTGTYRIDGTLELKGRKSLHLSIGAMLLKGEGSNSTTPVVRLDQLAVLEGRGIVSSVNPAPRGIVLIGPASTGYATPAGVAAHKKDCWSIGNVLFATIDGITVHGSGKAIDLAQNPPWTPKSTVVQCGSWVGDSERAGPQMSIGGGQIGICLDSGEITCGGACYQNTVRDVLIRYVDIGFYGGALVNSNMLYNLNFFNLQTAIWMEQNTENTFMGGFTGGGGFSPNTPAMLADAAIIRGAGSVYNFFSGIQGEPGHGRFLDISGVENTIIGHDNCPVGSTVSDDRLIWTNSGTLQAEKVIANQISQSFPANTTGSTNVLEVRLEPLVITEGTNQGKGTSNAVALIIGQLAAVEGGAAFRVTISALTTTGTNWINPTTVALATAELLIVPYCCKSGVPTSNGVWDARAQTLSAKGFVSNPQVITNGYQMTVTIPFTASTGVTPVLSRFVIVTTVLAGRVPMVINGRTFPIHAPTAHFANVSGHCFSQLQALCNGARRSSMGNCWVCEGNHQQQLESAGCGNDDLASFCEQHAPEQGEVAQLREVVASQEARIAKLEMLLLKSDDVTAQNCTATEPVIASCWGFDAVDSTQYLQAAIDSGASEVVVPRMDTPWILSSQPPRGSSLVTGYHGSAIYLRSNLRITLQRGVEIVARRGSFHHYQDNLFQGESLINVSIVGETGQPHDAKLTMWKLDYAHNTSYNYKPMDGCYGCRMGIALYHSKHILLQGFTVQKTGGDGVFLQDVNASRLSRLHLLDNFRQGLSVGAASGLVVEDCSFIDTGVGAAAAPACGVDIEPDNAGVLENITFRRCISANNTGCGLMASSETGVNTGSTVSIRFEDVHVDMSGQLDARACKKQSGGCGGSCRAAWGLAKWATGAGQIVFDRCTAIGAGINAPAVEIEIKGPDSLATFTNCSFGMSTEAASPAIALTPRYWPSPSTPDHILYGGLTVENTCIHTDGKLEPWLALVAPSGLSNVHVDAVLVQNKWSDAECSDATPLVAVNGTRTGVSVKHSCATRCPNENVQQVRQKSAQISSKLKSDDMEQIGATIVNSRRLKTSESAVAFSDPIALPFEVVAAIRQLPGLDEAGIATSANVAKTMHSPHKKGAVIRPNLRGTSYTGTITGSNVACQVRNAPFWVAKEHQFRFLVANCDVNHSYSKQWFTSPDGIQWTRAAAIADRTDRAPSYMVVYDENSTYPYKSISPCVNSEVCGGIQSSDGLTWNYTHSALDITSLDEQNLSYDPIAGRFFYTVKHYNTTVNPYGRSVALATTTDFNAENWTGARPVNHPRRRRLALTFDACVCRDERLGS